MKRWGIGINNYYFTSAIYLEEAPWYVFALESAVTNICHYFPRIPFPKIKIIIDGEETNLKDYYGSTRDLFHIYICIPVTNWCFRKIKSTNFDFPYLTLKENFPESFKFLEDYKNDADEEEKQKLKENEERSKLIGGEFNLVYKKLQDLGNTKVNL